MKSHIYIWVLNSFLFLFSFIIYLVDAEGSRKKDSQTKGSQTKDPLSKGQRILLR